MNESEGHARLFKRLCEEERTDEIREDLRPAIEQALADATRQVGRYLLPNELGRGGSGAVWRAWDRGLRRECALKLLWNRGDEQHQRRLEREASIAAQLDHPGIVKVHDVGSHEGAPYIVMEYVAGKSLDAVDLPPREALRVMHAVAEALAYAHERGVLHRDIKPANVLLGEDGQPRITDFGSARLERGGTTVTQSGTICGTPAFLAPEAATGAPPTTRTDIYGVGATLYALLAKRPPFDGESMPDVIRKVAAGQVEPLRKRTRSVGRDAALIVETAMALDPERRYGTAKAVADDLASCLAGRPVSARAPGLLSLAWMWTRSHRTQAGALLLIVLTIVAALVAQAVRLQRRLLADPHLQAGRNSLEQADRLFHMPHATLMTLRERLDEAVKALSGAVTVDPENPEAYFLRGKARFLRQADHDALSDLDEAIRRAPTNPAYRLLRAEVRDRLATLAQIRAELSAGQDGAATHEAERRRLLNGAEADLLEAARHSLNATDRLLAQARLAAARGDQAAASRLAGDGIASDPDRWEFYELHGMGRPPREAVDSILEALKRRPNDPRLFMAAAHTLEMTRDDAALRQALQHLTAALDRNPNDVETLASRARVHRKLLLFEEALADSTRLIVAEPSAAGGYYQRGQMHLFLDRHEEAIRDLQRAAELSPAMQTGWEYYNELACAHARAGHPDEVARCLGEALRRNPSEDQQIDVNFCLALARFPESPLRDLAQRLRGEPRFPTVARAFITRMLVDRLYPDPAASGQELQRVVTARPSKEAHRSVAVRRLRLGDFDGACATLPAQYLAQPREHRLEVLLLALARACRGPRGNSEGRPEDYPPDLFSPPDDIAYTARIGLGLACLTSARAGDSRILATAREHLEAARSIQGTPAEALLALGLLEHLGGNADRAMVCWQKAIAIRPEVSVLFLR